MTGVPGSGTILSHIESTGEMCIIMVWQKVKRGESLFTILSNKTGRTHLENETGMFMRKKHMKAIALGMAAVMTVTPVCPAVYAVDTTAQTGTEVRDSMHNINGDLTVTSFFNEKTNAVLFQDGDTYKFRFHNTSNGQYNYENYVIGIIGTAMDAYTGFLDEVAILRADTWGWGGGMSDFVTPDGNGNQIQFNTNIEYENNVFESMMQEGADCEVILRRVGDTIIYSAKIGDYTASSQMTSGITLPEDCYIFFTGENCSLTGFETEYTRNNEQTSTDAPEQTDTDAWEETTTRKPDSGTGDEDIAQEILTVEDIPDKALYAAILNYADSNGDGMIQKAEAAGIYFLSVYETVKDYTGLEYLTNLNSLFFGGTTDENGMAELLEKLSGLKELDRLYLPLNIAVNEDQMKILYQMALKTIDLYLDDFDLLTPEGAEDMPFFQSVENMCIRVKNKDFSFSKLSAVKNLQSISIYIEEDGKISDLSALGSFERLDQFFVSGNLSGMEITADALPPIGEIVIFNSGQEAIIDTRLFQTATYIRMNNMQLRGSFDDINKGIFSIQMTDCKLPDNATTVDLSRFTEVAYVYMDNMGLTEVSGLDKLKSLENLSLKQNKLTEITGLDKLGSMNSLDLSYNELSAVPALSGYPFNLYLQNNKITDTFVLSTLQNGSRISYLDLSDNEITSIKDANLISLSGLSNVDSLKLEGNKLSLDEVKGYVPEKCSADISWLAEATSVRAADVKMVYTWLNSELIASDIDAYMNGTYTGSAQKVNLNYYTTADSVLIESELLEFIREQVPESVLKINHVDLDNDVITNAVTCDFSKVPEDVNEFTININVTQVISAPEEVKDALGIRSVCAGFKTENSNPEYITISETTRDQEYNVYSYENAALKRIAKDIYYSSILEKIENGTYPEEGYYYVPITKDIYYNYTEEKGKYTDPMKNQEALMDNEAFLNAVESASEGDEITVTMAQGSILANVWNGIIEKKLSVNIRYVNSAGEIKYICHINYTDMKEIEEDHFVFIQLSDRKAEFNQPLQYYLTVLEYRPENNYFISSPMQGFKATMDVYAGINLANGENGYSLADTYYVLDKDMKKQLAYKAGDKTYLTTAGMITVELSSENNEVTIISTDMKDRKFAEAEIPEYSDDIVYKNGETVFEAAGKKISSLNVKGTGNNLTISTTIDFESSLYDSGQVLYTLESRKSSKFIAIKRYYGELTLDTSFGERTFFESYMLEEGVNEVTTNLTEAENGGTHIIILVGNKKAYEGDLDMKLSDMETFYSEDSGLNNTYFGYNGKTSKIIGTKILAGTVLPADIVEGNVVRKTDEITGDYKIGGFFTEKTDAVELKSGDTYTFTFHNKSTGSNNWENYVMAVIGEIGYDYVDSSDEVLIVRADAWGWGGGKSDFMAPDFNTENSLVFTSNIDDWNAWNELMASGADCKVTLSRNGDTLAYTAVMGSYEVKCTAVSGYSLPESCYVFFTGENCELTGFKTVKEKQPEETTTEETTSKEEVTSTEEETTTKKVEETTTKKEEATSTEEETTTKKVEETTTKKEEATSKEEETTTKKVEETTTKKEEATSKEEETTTKKVEETTTKKEEATSKEDETSTKKVEEESTSKKEDKVNKSEPDKVSDSKIVDSEKVLTTAVDKMKSTILKTIEVVSDKAQTLTKEVFDTIQKEGKNLTVGVTDEDNKLQYSWTFSNRTLADTDMNIDLGIKFDTEKKEEIKKLTGREDAMYLSFAHHGELPGPATIKSYVGDNYQNGEKIYLYYFDEEQNKILMIGNTALEVKDGYVEYTITHCSTYFFMEEKLDGVEKDARSLDDASLSVTDEKAVLTINGTKVPTNESTAVTETTNTTKADNTTATTKQKAADIPATGDTADSVRYLVMMFAFAVITVLTGNAVKRNKNK